MKFIFSYLKKFWLTITFVMVSKFVATYIELQLPAILERLVDEIAPTRDLRMVIIWGAVMVLLALAAYALNIIGNRTAVLVSKNAAYEIRRDLFWHSVNLSGSQMDEFGLPSLTSRMTSDSYNVQDFTRMFQSIGVRAPIMLLGGVIVTMRMDPGLGLILCILAPVSIAIVVFVSAKGIPLYDKVQQSIDNIVRVMRENITGIRVVKALSKEDYEMRRFGSVNDEMFRRECKAGITMSLPGPLMTLLMNIGLTLVVYIGATRVNNGRTEPGVILAFLTYFNMILMGVMALNRVLLMMSKANASANRIAAVVNTQEELGALPESAAAVTDSDAFISFENVSFRYGSDSRTGGSFAGGERQMSLSEISFSVKKGGSLGIIGPTGCGKTTIINLLMRFYDPVEGHVFLDGKDIRTYEKDELHRKFGVVFQNDIVFADTLAENIAFGREVSDEAIRAAAADACAAEFIEGYEDTYQHRTAIHGADLSGGQRQRILISRAFAADPEILVLDDASSALDYKTDAALRQAVHAHHSHATTIIVAQRVSSIMNLDQILVMDEGRIIGQGSHEELLRSCPAYYEIYKTQMGEEG